MCVLCSTRFPASPCYAARAAPPSSVHAHHTNFISYVCRSHISNAFPVRGQPIGRHFGSRLLRMGDCLSCCGSRDRSYVIHVHHHIRVADLHALRNGMAPPHPSKAPPVAVPLTRAVAPVIAPPFHDPADPWFHEPLLERPDDGSTRV